jgi:hypothetical protein
MVHTMKSTLCSEVQGNAILEEAWHENEAEGNWLIT